jgi:hypothetical protein
VNGAVATRLPFFQDIVRDWSREMIAT